MLNPGRWTIFVDSNVWYSRTLRDWLGMLYVTPEAPPFHVRWTEDVLAELLYHLRKQHPPNGMETGSRAFVTRLRKLSRSEG